MCLISQTKSICSHFSQSVFTTFTFVEHRRCAPAALNFFALTFNIIPLNYLRISMLHFLTSCHQPLQRHSPHNKNYSVNPFKANQAVCSTTRFIFLMTYFQLPLPLHACIFTYDYTIVLTHTHIGTQVREWVFVRSLPFLKLATAIIALHFSLSSSASYSSTTTKR